MAKKDNLVISVLTWLLERFFDLMFAIGLSFAIWLIVIYYWTHT